MNSSAAIFHENTVSIKEAFSKALFLDDSNPNVRIGIAFKVDAHFQIHFM